MQNSDKVVYTNEDVVKLLEDNTKLNVSSTLDSIEIPDIDEIDNYNDLVRIKKKIEKVYHDNIVLIASIKFILTDDDRYEEFFMDEFKNNDMVAEMIKNITSEKVDFNYIYEYLNDAYLRIDILNVALENIKNKCLYGMDTINYRKRIDASYNDKKFTRLLDFKDTKNLIDKVKSVVVSQDEAVEDLVTEISQIPLMNDISDKDGILITGSTGVGKTLTIQTLGELLDRDVCIIDASALVVNGYKGMQITDALLNCYYDCDKDLDRLENAIIFFDEIDKKGMMTGDSDIASVGVINSLLKFLDGTVYNLSINSGKTVKNIRVDTSNMIVIFGGSFSSVYENRPRPVGFNVSAEEFFNPAANVTEEDFVKRGRMTPEFMGRNSIFIHFNNLDLEGYKNILKNSKKSPLKARADLFNSLGIRLTVEDDYYTEVATLADKSKKGARSLRGIVKKTTRQVLKDISDHFEEIDEVILNAETVLDNSKYKVVSKKEKVLKKC